VPHTEPKLRGDGFVDALVLMTRSVMGDLFVDCTGPPRQSVVRLTMVSRTGAITCRVTG
jgi:hypothetical protein